MCGGLNEAAILSSLLEVKSALNVMNARIQSLEITTSLLVTTWAHLLSTSDMARAAPLPPDVTPHRTLGTAVPAPTMGSWFLPPPAAIPDSLRNQILTGVQNYVSPGQAPQNAIALHSVR